MCHFLPVYYLGIVFLGRGEGQNITRALEITYSCEKIPGVSYINWRTRIRNYVLMQKYPSLFIYQLVNEDSRLSTHAKNPSRFIHHLVKEDSRLRTHAKKSQEIHTSTGERGFEITFSREKIPVDLYINSWKSIWDYVLTQKHPNSFIHQLGNDNPRLHTHAKNFSWFIWDYVLTWKNTIWFIHHLVNEDSTLRTHAKNPTRFIPNAGVKN